MSTATIVSTIQREPELLGQTVVIGGSGGIGIEISRRARMERAKGTLAGRNPERLQHAASGVDALSAAAFDAVLTIHIMTKTALMSANLRMECGQHFVAA
jgi:short-subunit dehydrogenase involved in D-alanine esterification of teichoic acids